MKSILYQPKIFSEPPIFSVTEYTLFINELVGLEPVVVEGEVSNFRDIPGRNFCYFDIKDDKSVAKCFQGFWHSKKVALQNGARIRVFGVPNMQKNGSLVIDVREIYMTGKGALMEAYLKLKSQLEKEGLFDQQSKKNLPSFPKTVGLIAGKNSSAYHDVTVELVERWPGLKIYFLPAKVQGMYAKKEIVQAIQHFNRNQPVEVLIVARGGGSLEDLQAFDSEEVVREIFASKIPIISAIGHEDHWTLADFVADMRAKTPTKAAQIVVPDKKEIRDRLEYFSDRMKSILRYQIETEKSKGQHLWQQLNRSMLSQLENSRSFLQVYQDKIQLAMQSQLEKENDKFRHWEKQLALLNPISVLERGYCVLESGKTRLRSIRQIKVKDQFKATLMDGELVATADEILTKK